MLLAQLRLLFCSGAGRDFQLPWIARDRQIGLTEPATKRGSLPCANRYLDYSERQLTITLSPNYLENLTDGGIILQRIRARPARRWSVDRDFYKALAEGPRELIASHLIPIRTGFGEVPAGHLFRITTPEGTAGRV